jgi:hypothetical protein
LRILLSLIEPTAGTATIGGVRYADASNVMITPGRAFPDAPPQWAGLVIMVGYALVLAATGIVLTRRRDVT